MNYQKSISENEIELNKKIIAIRFRIQNEFPKLSKYLDETPVTTTSEAVPEINAETLNNYYESLFKFLAFYKQELAQKESLNNN